MPEPVPGAGEVRIRIHAAAVSPTDLLLRSGAQAATLESRGLKPPYVPGMDLAGTVDTLGKGSDRRWTLGAPVVASVLPFHPEPTRKRPSCLRSLSS